jgi:hypothetical protein
MLIKAAEAIIAWNGAKSGKKKNLRCEAAARSHRIKPNGRLHTVDLLGPPFIVREEFSQFHRALRPQYYVGIEITFVDLAHELTIATARRADKEHTLRVPPHRDDLFYFPFTAGDHRAHRVLLGAETHAAKGFDTHTFVDIAIVGQQRTSDIALSSACRFASVSGPTPLWR